jgi:hypothetical protein
MASTAKIETSAMPSAQGRLGRYRSHCAAVPVIGSTG